MVWDLRGALLKKQEVETARLADFAFRLRVRTMRLLAPSLGLDPEELARMAARQPDGPVLVALSDRCSVPLAELTERHAVLQATARDQLIAERGDPTPYRLA